jgi:outer membrane protein assembly factor BamA
VNRYSYGFRQRPYSSVVGLQAEYAAKVDGFRVTMAADQRRERSPLHFFETARMSQFEVINYYGLGNATPGDPASYYQVRQRQLSLNPAVGRTLGSRGDLSFGPLVKYAITDSTPNTFLSATRPYGFGRFGEAGLQLSLQRDTRDVVQDPRHGLRVNFTGNFFPALWDVTSAFGSIAAGATAYFTFPVPIHPVLVLSGGGKKVYGEFPFHEAAFVGGSYMLRSLDAQRYAGDAALYGSAELRFPFPKFAFVLPWDVGLFGVVDAGRVYVNGDSPGGWHTAAGIGFWVGVPDPSTSIRWCRQTSGGGPC